MAAVAPRVSSPTFVGRRAELDRFAAALADVSGERPVLLLGRIDESLETLDQAKRVATEIGAIEDLVRAYKYIGGTLYLVWRNEEAATALYTGFELAQRHGLVGSHGFDSLNTRFWALMDGGRWGEAEHTADLIERNRPHAPSTLAAMILHATPAALAIATGRIEEAERHITALEALAERDEEGGVRGEALGARAYLSLVQGRPLETRRLVRLIMAATEAREGTPRSIAESHALGIRAEAEVAASSRRGDDETRRTASAVATDHLDHMRELHASVKRERPAFAPQTEAYLALCEAEAGRVDGRADPAAWSVAARRFEALGTPLHVAYARFREGEALLASSRGRAEARGSLGEAYRIAVRVGAAPLRDDIEALARHARLPLPQPESGEAATPTHDRFGLTKREREVLELLTAGNTNRQIATTLYISEKTAGAHLSKILSKLDVRGRTEAAAVAHREGLLVPASQSLVVGDVLR
jgi:DNA-binding CsgD family transcriptional regulator